MRQPQIASDLGIHNSTINRERGRNVDEERSASSPGNCVRSEEHHAGQCPEFTRHEMVAKAVTFTSVILAARDKEA